MLPFNATAYLSRNAGFNRFGEAVRTPECALPVAVIQFKNVAKKSPIRSGQSASQGRDEDQEAQVVLLCAADADVQLDDQLRLYGVNLVISDVWPQADLFGVARQVQLTLTRMEAV